MIADPYCALARYNRWMNENIYAVAPGGIRSLDQELYADFDELRRERGTTDAVIESWVGQIAADRLAAPFRFVRRGVRSRCPFGGPYRSSSTIRRIIVDRSPRFSCKQGAIPA